MSEESIVMRIFFLGHEVYIDRGSNNKSKRIGGGSSSADESAEDIALSLVENCRVKLVHIGTKKEYPADWKKCQANEQENSARNVWTRYPYLQNNMYRLVLSQFIPCGEYKMYTKWTDTDWDPSMYVRVFTEEQFQKISNARLLDAMLRVDNEGNDVGWTYGVEQGDNRFGVTYTDKEIDEFCGLPPAEGANAIEAQTVYGVEQDGQNFNNLHVVVDNEDVHIQEAAGGLNTTEVAMAVTQHKFATNAGDVPLFPDGYGLHVKVVFNKTSPTVNCSHTIYSSNTNTTSSEKIVQAPLSSAEYEEEVLYSLCERHNVNVLIIPFIKSCADENSLLGLSQWAGSILCHKTTTKNDEWQTDLEVINLYFGLRTVQINIVSAANGVSIPINNICNSTNEQRILCLLYDLRTFVVLDLIFKNIFKEPIKRDLFYVELSILTLQDWYMIKEIFTVPRRNDKWEDLMDLLRSNYETHERLDTPLTVREVMLRKKNLYPHDSLDEKIITNLHGRFSEFKSVVENMQRLMYLHFLFRKNKIYDFVFTLCDVFQIATLHEWIEFAKRNISITDKTLDYTISRLFNSNDKLKRLYIKQNFKLVLYELVMCELLENREAIVAYCSGDEHKDYQIHVYEPTHYDILLQIQLLQRNDRSFMPEFHYSSPNGGDRIMYNDKYYEKLVTYSKRSDKQEKNLTVADLHYVYLKEKGNWPYPDQVSGQDAHYKLMIDAKNNGVLPRGQYESEKRFAAPETYNKILYRSSQTLQPILVSLGIESVEDLKYVSDDWFEYIQADRFWFAHHKITYRSDVTRQNIKERYTNWFDTHKPLPFL